MSEIIINESDLYRMACAREELAGGSLDAKRPAAWSAYGYPEHVTFSRLLAAYERGGAAHGAVQRLLDGCWQALPRIKRPDDDKVSPWEVKVSAALKAVNAWAKLRDLDRRNMVGRFAAVIYRVRDGKPLRDPLERAAALVDLVPVYEDQIRITQWVSDPAREDYGQPAMWQVQTRRPGADDQGMPIAWLDVHPSRLQVLAEGAVGDDFFAGVPLLRAGFNALVDLEKISGGSAESYLKNSSRTLVFKYDKDASLQALGADGKPVDVRQLHEDRARALNRSIDAAAVVKGGDVSTLQTSIADPSKPFEVAACMFASSVRLPFTILFGQQTGRLASGEDKADFQARCKSRQANELTPMLEQFVRRMQACGIIEAGEWVIEWPDIAAPSDQQKLEHAKAMADVNRTAPGAGGEASFTADEIRRAAGYEPMEALPMGEGGDPGADA